MAADFQSAGVDDRQTVQRNGQARPPLDGLDGSAHQESAAAGNNSRQQGDLWGLAMITGAAILMALERLGIEIETDGARLRWRPAELVPGELAERILARRDEVIALLQVPGKNKFPARSDHPAHLPSKPSNDVDGIGAAIIRDTEAQLATMFASATWRAAWDERHAAIGNADGCQSVRRVVDEIMEQARFLAALGDVEAARVNCALAIATATGQHWRPCAAAAVAFVVPDNTEVLFQEQGDA